ncbi:probable receptor-like serine/threonine-protein kinase At4g34500 [Diospyros lotus]|uniref:probable receptor-like serine/threonine-protein kinase At4g34500 n=1 Tax=Diospyros lotus TaxID=55363 RepID=UPI00224DFC7C|nr:probable receptor-like serine/threonine-protein kinase At4g34500 [Diospyros lotus]
MREKNRRGGVVENGDVNGKNGEKKVLMMRETHGGDGNGIVNEKGDGFFDLMPANDLTPANDPMEAQRVMVIQDASKEVSLSALKWPLRGLCLKPGDMLALLSIVHEVKNPMGYKIRVDSSMFGANQRIVAQEIDRKKKEYRDNEELAEISQKYQMKQIVFKIKVDAGPSPKMVAYEAAKRIRATWVILDRKMEKDKKYFLEKIPSGISRITSNNSIEQLRGPKARAPTSSLCHSESSSHFTDEKFILEPILSENDTKPKTENLGTVAPDAIENQYDINSIDAQEKIPDQIPRLSGRTEDLTAPLDPEKSYDESSCESHDKIGWMREFSYEELQAATDGFSPENIVFEGGHAAVFRGELKDKLMIAIKENKDASSQGERKFNSEVQVLGKIRHENVVVLLGSCSEGNQRLLVYEYVGNGSLDQHLTESKPLTWGVRMTITLGVSRALNHLHANNIIHRDVTPNNILVTHDYEPLLGGFGIATTQHDSDQSLDHGVLGTFGYLAPEYAEAGIASNKTDIYSFGVVLLQLITGRSTKDKTLPEKSLVGWARALLKQKKYAEMADSRIFLDTHQFNWTVQLAEKCLSQDPENRPSMDEVVSTLENIMEGKTPWGQKKSYIQYEIQ